MPESVSAQDKEGFLGILGVCMAVICMYSIMFSIQRYIASYLGVFWRMVLTKHLHQKYLKSKMYYQLNCIDTSIDNAWVMKRD
jgi:ABC-type uncharacterized transport system fused permease/ATPase subunit